MFAPDSEFSRHTSKKYELDGNWDSGTGRMLLWFPIGQLSVGQTENFDSDERTQKLLNQLGTITESPDMCLVTTDDVPTDSYNPLIPFIEKSGESLNIEGLVVVTTRYLSQMGKSAMERCELMIENVYSDQLLARVEN